MIDIQLKNSPTIQETSSIFQCPLGHKLIDADRTKRKRKNGTVYSTPGIIVIYVIEHFQMVNHGIVHVRIVVLINVLVVLFFNYMIWIMIYYN